MSTEIFGVTTGYISNVILSELVAGVPHENLVGILGRPNYNGVAESISAYVKRIFSNDEIICALYDSDLNFIAQTEEKLISNTTLAWITFNFSEPKPELSSEKDYYITLIGDCPLGLGSNQYLVAENSFSPGSVWVKQLDITYPTFPDPMAPTIYTTAKVSIYCTYTVDSDKEGKISTKQLSYNQRIRDGSNAGTQYNTEYGGDDFVGNTYLVTDDG